METREQQLDRWAEHLARLLTDPTHPFNQLKRAARRKCLYCNGVYRSKVSILCDPGFCSPEHQQLAAKQAGHLAGLIQFQARAIVHQMNADGVDFNHEDLVLFGDQIAGRVS